jgi:hypothetical protein
MEVVHGRTRPVSVAVRVGISLAVVFAWWVATADAQQRQKQPPKQQQQCRVTGPTCTDAKAQCRALRKTAFPDKSNNPCANRFRRCMATGKYVSRNCNVVMEKR